MAMRSALSQFERAARDQLPHVASFDILHGDEMHAVHFVQIEDGADVRMIQRRSEARFALEAFEVGFLDGQFRRQDFDDDRATELRIDGLINCALPARAEFFQNAVIV